MSARLIVANRDVKSKIWRLFNVPSSSLVTPAVDAQSTDAIPAKMYALLFDCTSQPVQVAGVPIDNIDNDQFVNIVRMKLVEQV